MRNFGNDVKVDCSCPASISEFLFWTNLNPGEKFHIGEREIVYTSIKKLTPKNRGKLSDGFSHKISLTITKKNGKGILETKKKYLYIFKEITILGTLGREYDWIHQIMRDIEGIVIVDKLNVYNPFHEESFFSKVSKRELVTS